MPKMKTHKGSKKRFKVTGTGKLKRRKAGKRHLLSHMTAKRKRQLRSTESGESRLEKKYVVLIGGKNN